MSIAPPSPLASWSCATQFVPPPPPSSSSSTLPPNRQHVEFCKHGACGAATPPILVPSDSGTTGPIHAKDTTPTAAAAHSLRQSLPVSTSITSSHAATIIPVTHAAHIAHYAACVADVNPHVVTAWNTTLFASDTLSSYFHVLYDAMLVHYDHNMTATQQAWCAVIPSHLHVLDVKQIQVQPVIDFLHTLHLWPAYVKYVHNRWYHNQVMDPLSRVYALDCLLGNHV